MAGIRFLCVTAIALLVRGAAFGQETVSSRAAASGSDRPLAQLPFNQVRLEDEFWLPRIQIQKETLIPFAFEKTKPAVENLKRTADFRKGIKGELPFPHRYVGQQRKGSGIAALSERLDC